MVVAPLRVTYFFPFFLAYFNLWLMVKRIWFGVGCGVVKWRKLLLLKEWYQGNFEDILYGKNIEWSRFIQFLCVLFAIFAFNVFYIHFKTGFVWTWEKWSFGLNILQIEWNKEEILNNILWLNKQVIRYFQPW